ncbi:MAG: hypothetical protein VX733_05125 [Candidatus Latescibacterota bacterium]|nr:hypothetical protein [Candidatus Latescibacterota bacterium]
MKRYLDMLLSLRCLRPAAAWGLCLGWLWLAPAPLPAQDEDRPEDPALGPVRLMPDQPFLGRFGRQTYTNYGIEDYSRRPVATSNLRNLYNSLGDPLLHGTQSIRWVERRGLGVNRGFSNVGEGGSHGTGRGGTDYSPAGGSFANLFNYVMVGSDGTDAWQARAIYANELRSKFTPLTFKMSNADGLRVDVGTENDQFSAVFQNLTPSGGHFIVPTTMFGAHYGRKVGFLNFGASFVNAHQFEHQMSGRFQSMKGAVGNIQRATAMTALRISDGSPNDGRDGAVLHNVKVYINGELRPDAEPFIIRLNQRGNDRNTYVAGLLGEGTDDERRRPLESDYQTVNKGAVFNSYSVYINYAAFDTDTYYRGYEHPYFIDHLYYRDLALMGPDHEYEDGITVHNQFAHELVEPSGEMVLHTEADLPQAFDGDEYGMLYVDLEPFQEQINSVEVELELSRDYHVEVSEIDLAGKPDDSFSDNPRDRYNYATFFRTVAATPGNTRSDDVKTVRVKIGAPTGLSIYSANVYGVYKGFLVDGEFSRSRSFYQYASGIPGPRVYPRDGGETVNALLREENPGARSSLDDNAYYLAVTRDFDRFGVGAEVFSMGDAYNTELRTHIGRSEVNYGNPIAYNNTYLHRLVEDNDDNDRYPDSWYTNRPFIWNGQSDLDGVFPGLDEDNDGVPDTNRDFDATPDYLEPFLTYDVDPQVYDFGLDLNHNDYIDARENDLQPDLPYDPGLEGRHMYGTFKPLTGVRMTLGLMDAQQIAAGDPSKSLYGRLGYERRIPTLGQFRGAFFVESVEDGVEDPLSVYADEVLTAAEQLQREFGGFQRNIRISPFLEKPYEDPLLFKNSTYTRLFIDARWTTLPGLNIHNKVKYEVNRQREGKIYDGTSQDGNTLSRWAMVHRVDHLWQIRPKLSMFSGLKYRFLREWQKTEDVTVQHETHIIPILKLTYELTLRSRLQFGVEGIRSLLPYSVTDLAQPENDFEQSDYVLMLTNNSKYFGYIISTNAGVSRRRRAFDDPAVALTKDEKFTAIFINVTLGFEDETY